jgi:hypothetical protein
MDFAIFAHLLRGSPPSVLDHGQLGQHRQTWRLREYVLLSPAPNTSSTSSIRNLDANDNGNDKNDDSNNNATEDDPLPLPPGSPVRAHFPVTALLKEHAGQEELSVQKTDTSPAVVYVRSTSVVSKILSASSSLSETSARTHGREELLKSLNARVKDVLIIGEVRVFFFFVLLEVI